jgi:hypothetical protein
MQRKITWLNFSILLCFDKIKFSDSIKQLFNTTNAGYISLHLVNAFLYIITNNENNTTIKIHT